MKEHQSIEWKESWRDEYLKWICGFANSNGGKLYIGITDNGKISGIDNYGELLALLPNKFRDILGVFAEVNLKVEDSKHYLEIIVPRCDVPISLRGKYYVRIGSTLQELKGPALNDFILKRAGKTWDDITVEFASVNEIDENAIKYFLQIALKSKRISSDAVKENTITLLKNLHLMNEKGELKNAALLLFGIDLQKYFRSSYFKIGRFGETDDDLRFQDVVDGNLIEMADKILNILRSKYLVSNIRYEGLQRIEDLEYPEAALREAILNAIVHKDYTGSSIQFSVYDNKIMIWNPGGLPDELSIEMLKKKHPSLPRNKNIAEMFFKAGYIEAWGRGISIIIDACNKAGLPEPVIEEAAGGFQITFLKDIFSDEYLQKLNLNIRQIKAAKYVKKNGFITNAIYQKINNLKQTISSQELHNLVEKGVLKSSGSKGRGAKYSLAR